MPLGSAEAGSGRYLKIPVESILMQANMNKKTGKDTKLRRFRNIESVKSTRNIHNPFYFHYVKYI